MFLLIFLLFFFSPHPLNNAELEISTVHKKPLPQKTNPNEKQEKSRGKKLTPFTVLQEIHLLKYICFYIYRYHFFKFKHPKFKREREKNKTKQVSSPSPPPESVDPCLSKIRKSYLQKEEPEEGESVGKRRMRL